MDASSTYPAIWKCSREPGWHSPSLTKSGLPPQNIAIVWPASEKMHEVKQTNKIPTIVLPQGKMRRKSFVTVKAPRFEVGGLSKERGMIALQKSLESTMGFLCMSPNGPLYGQNVWAMRIYASSSYLDPCGFTPTNSTTGFILLWSLWMSEFFQLISERLHSHRRGWDCWDESVIPRDSTDCWTGWEIKREIQWRDCSGEELELKMRPQGIVRWVNITMSRECRDESNHHGNQVKVKVDIVMESESGKVNITINGWAMSMGMK